MSLGREGVAGRRANERKGSMAVRRTFRLRERARWERGTVVDQKACRDGWKGPCAEAWRDGWNTGPP